MMTMKKWLVSSSFFSRELLLGCKLMILFSTSFPKPLSMLPFRRLPSTNGSHVWNRFAVPAKSMILSRSQQWWKKRNQDFFDDSSCDIWINDTDWIIFAISRWRIYTQPWKMTVYCLPTVYFPQWLLCRWLVPTQLFLPCRFRSRGTCSFEMRELSTE